MEWQDDSTILYLYRNSWYKGSFLNAEQAGFHMLKETISEPQQRSTGSHGVFDRDEHVSSILKWNDMPAWSAWSAHCQ
jgi:hypothetical protein